MKLLFLLKNQTFNLSKYESKNSTYIIKKLDFKFYFVLYINVRLEINLVYVENEKIIKDNIYIVTNSDVKEYKKHIQKHIESVQALTDIAIQLNNIDSIINIQEIINLLNL